MGARYRADPPDMRLAVTAETMTLIHHRPSGITHVVASPVPEILVALAQGPADAREIIARLAVAHDIATDGAAEAAVAARLDELAAAGLIAPA
jgi:PqqD family protein of HPr-rel-A system